MQSQVSETLHLEGFDAVVLDTDLSLEARECELGMPPAPIRAVTGVSPAKITAREARYPMLASTEGAFMSAMSAEAQNIAELTLQDTLEEWQVRMNMVAAHLKHWLHHEMNAASTSPSDVERKYTQEPEMIATGSQASGKLEPLFDIGENTVGFRMGRTLWDRPGTWC